MLNVIRPCLQQISIYKTRNRFIIIGKDIINNVYRIIEANTGPNSSLDSFHLIEDSLSYSIDDINHYIESNQLVSYATNCIAIYGFINLLESYYIILITKSNPVASLHGHIIYTITDTTIIPVSFKQRNTIDETRYRNIINKINFNCGYYFSFTYDLTNSLQSNFLSVTNRSIESSTSHISQCADDFIWNHSSIQPLLNTESSSNWIIPIIHGYINQLTIKLNDHLNVVKYTLIARRSRHFAGTRNLRRGINSNGYVANYIETEQIITKCQTLLSTYRSSSFIQIRGSVPLYWSHINIYKPSPDIQLEEMDHELKPLVKHFQRFQLFGYKSIYVLNLIRRNNKHVREFLLGSAYTNAVEYINQISTNNKDCDSYDDVSNLFINYIQYDILHNNKTFYKDLQTIALNIYQSIGFFVQSPESHINSYSNPSNSKCTDTYNEIEYKDYSTIYQDKISPLYTNIDTNKDINGIGSGYPIGTIQSGVLRTNCIDCLDRTNIGQFVYAMTILSYQFESLGIQIQSNQIHRDIMKIWTEHGDELSKQYGGSKAMHKPTENIEKNNVFDSKNWTEIIWNDIIGSTDKSTCTPLDNCDSVHSDNNDTTDNNISYELIHESNNYFSETDIILSEGASNALVSAQRYYSNISTDFERQQAIDILLGVFVPKKDKPQIWDIDLKPQAMRSIESTIDKFYNKVYLPIWIQPKKIYFGQITNYENSLIFSDIIISIDEIENQLSNSNVVDNVSYKTFPYTTSDNITKSESKSRLKSPGDEIEIVNPYSTMYDQLITDLTIISNNLINNKSNIQVDSKSYSYNNEVNINDLDIYQLYSDEIVNTTLVQKNYSKINDNSSKIDSNHSNPVIIDIEGDSTLDSQLNYHTNISVEEKLISNKNNKEDKYIEFPKFNRSKRILITNIPIKSDSLDSESDSERISENNDDDDKAMRTNHLIISNKSMNLLSQSIKSMFTQPFNLSNI